MALANTVSTDRTDRQIFDQEPITVKLAGQEYEIKPTTKARAKEFRAAAGKLRGFIALATELFRIALSDDEKVNIEEIANTLLLGYTEKLDEAYELVYIYCPNIETDRDRLEHRDTGATDSEWQIALWSVLKVTFGPFVQALGLKNGKGKGLLDRLAALGVEYQKTKQNKHLAAESINGIKNESMHLDTPDSPTVQQDGESSPEKSSDS